MLVVTGANGFIGSVMVWQLNQAGYTNIICTDTVSLEERPNLLKNKKFSQFIETENFLEWLKDSDNVQSLKGIFHMGACSDTSEMDREFLRINNTEYTKTLFHVCSANKIPYIYASSGAVYGDGKLGFNDKEDSNVFKPLNPYGDSKLEFDKWVTRQSTTPPHWYGLRFFNVYGPNEYHKKDMCSVVFKAFNQIGADGSLKLFRSHNEKFKDGEQMRDFVYVKDITRWMLELYLEQKAESGIYNLGFGKARTWLDLATSTFKNMNQPLNISWIDVPEKLKHQYQYYTEANISKLLEQGLTQPQWPLEDGIKDYVRNYLLKDNPIL